MSISLATMGKFQNCCGSRGTTGGGGAPPYRQNEDEKIKPRILVKKVETEDIDHITESITVKLVDN
ncbi:MAG: hypothetical protein ACFFG0_02180 [Candidatus Thorarchaeota archaeon]